MVKGIDLAVWIKNAYVHYVHSAFFKSEIVQPALKSARSLLNGGIPLSDQW